MGAIGFSEYATDAAAGTDAEREELEWLLTSGVLGRSGNLARVLKFICEERFAGRAHQIKEYTIATEALGRRSDFDPHTDTIVRVTVHSLRKRLVEVYQNEGADRPIRLVLPPGRYAPCFVPAKHVEAPPGTASELDSATEDPAGSALISAPAETTIAIRPPVPRTAWRIKPAIIGLVALLIAALALWAIRYGQIEKSRVAESASAAQPLPPPQAMLRVLMGGARRPYVDHSGNTWTTGHYCQGGNGVTVPAQRIEGTEDAPLYLGGVRGMAHCAFPVPKGLYELHFHFAETTDLAAATRLATLSINAGPIIGVDVVDDAGGDGIATSTVVTGVTPENDGSIHVDYTSEISPLNALEILPAPSAKLLPVRIVVSPRPFVDSDRQVWASDRYFSGGRHGQQPKSAGRVNLGMYESDRVGRFRYTIPVVPLARYRVKLYFREPWFGKENGGIGGPGSRVFDVACNGILLLKNFDILVESGSAPTVKTFENVQASAGGRIELSFTPVVNYAVVSAIEVLPED